MKLFHLKLNKFGGGASLVLCARQVGNHYPCPNSTNHQAIKLENERKKEEGGNNFFLFFSRMRQLHPLTYYASNLTTFDAVKNKLLYLCLF